MTWALHPECCLVWITCTCQETVRVSRSANENVSNHEHPSPHLSVPDVNLPGLHDNQSPDEVLIMYVLRLVILLCFVIGRLSIFAFRYLSVCLEIQPGRQRFWCCVHLIDRILEPSGQH